MALPALAVLLSAFLLFLVQPLMGRLILPWFGGSAAVWTACLVFFQTSLVAGYAYAALSIRLMPPRAQRMLHVALLALSLLALPILPSIAWRPTESGHALVDVAGLLLATVGLPYMLLAATGPLVQTWLAGENRSPWRLYALSNLAAILALAAYPFAIEPWFALRPQAYLWSAFYGLYVLLVGLLAWRTRWWRATPRAPSATPRAGQAAVWVALAALPTALLVATTEHLTRDVTAIPLLWMPPLVLYLLSFVIWFDGRLPFHRAFWMLAMAAAVLVMARALALVGLIFEPVESTALLCGGMFVVCLYCHGELARRRPGTPGLGIYYFLLALGGALGGLLVAVVAPAVLSEHHDLPILLAAMAIPLLIGAASFERRLLRSAGVVCALAAAAGGAYAGHRRYVIDRQDIVSVQRNIYGTLKVIDQGKDTADHRREFMHGTILHGLQYRSHSRRREATAYYQQRSGVGLALASLKEEPRRIAVIGLGAGTIAAWGRAGDIIVFYEIDALVERVARRDFSFLADSPATVEIVLADGRLSLEREPPRHFDLLVIDAFSGNAPPLHLLTAEAFAVYIRHMAPEGVIALQVSSKFFDFGRFVIAALATHGWIGGLVANDTSDWIIAARQAVRLQLPPLGGELRQVDGAGTRAWTDDHIDVLRAWLGP
ncbi:fused MFS/spermidine synthase [soil metagenome]